MKTTLDYLNEAKQRLDIKSDYKLAKWLGSDTAVISNYRQKKRVIDDYTAARIADALGIDPMEVIAAANAEREKDERKREYWRQIVQKSAAACLLAGVLLVQNQGIECGHEFTNLALCAVIAAFAAAWFGKPWKLRNQADRQPHDRKEEKKPGLPQAAL